MKGKFLREKKIRKENSKANHIRLKSKENQLQNDARTGESRLRGKTPPSPKKKKQNPAGAEINHGHRRKQEGSGFLMVDMMMRDIEMIRCQGRYWLCCP